MVFTYCIVLKGGSDKGALVHGNLYAPNLDTAKRYVQTVKAPDLRGRTALEVILRDDKGKEVWRGPMARKYEETYRRILERIASGFLVHADETKGVVFGGGHYV